MLDEKFKQELRSKDIPMKDYCLELANRHVKEEVGHFCDPNWINMLAITKVQEAWDKVTGHVPSIQPNHRWNCIESELNSDWMKKNWSL